MLPQVASGRAAAARKRLPQPTNQSSARSDPAALSHLSRPQRQLHRRLEALLPGARAGRRLVPVHVHAARLHRGLPGPRHLEPSAPGRPGSAPPKAGSAISLLPAAAAGPQLCPRKGVRSRPRAVEGKPHQESRAPPTAPPLRSGHAHGHAHSHGCHAHTPSRSAYRRRAGAPSALWSRPPASRRVVLSSSPLATPPSVGPGPSFPPLRPSASHAPLPALLKSHLKPRPSTVSHAPFPAPRWVPKAQLSLGSGPGR